MRKILTLLFALLMAISCRHQTRDSITIGTYSFSFPKDFDLIKEDGIDSYVGKITNKHVSLGFDYGYYSDKLIPSPEEYIESKQWLTRFVSDCNQETPIERQVSISDIGILNIRKSNFSDHLRQSESEYTALLKWRDGKQLEYQIEIPEDFKPYTIQIDTIENCLRKIVIAKNPYRGLTGIYLRDLKGHNESINSSLALSMSSSRLTKSQQDSLLKIFNTLKIKKAT